MASLNAIAADKLLRLVGTPAAPLVIDVRANPHTLLPGSVPRGAEEVEDWAAALRAKPVVVACDLGREFSAGIAAKLRSEGVAAEILEGGFEAWRASGAPTIDSAILPARDDRGRTMW